MSLSRKKNAMPTCVPIKDMRDTVKFSELVNSNPGPITVTKNGRDEFVVMRSKDYDTLIEEKAKAELMARMYIAEKERTEGKFFDAHDSLSEIREKYGL
jgi:prevent-host-death family protein